MTRKLFRGAPELSRLFAEAPVVLLRAFLARPAFSELLGPDTFALPTADEAAEKASAAALLKRLPEDRVAMMEIEARRIAAMADEVPAALLVRLTEDARFDVPDLSQQRDALARSIWAFTSAKALFETAERAMHVRLYRGHGKLYEAWSLDSEPISLIAGDVDCGALEREIADLLHRDEGCRVEAVDLPIDEGGSREVLIAVTFFGMYASQKRVRPDKTTEVFYFRPPNEMLLVYTAARRRIEVCSPNPTDRRVAARVFAEETLGHDVSNKPLNQKSYNLSRFRRTLRLPVPEAEAHLVKRASVTEVQVALGDWSRRLTLSALPEDDIDALARKVLGAIIPPSGGGFITKVGFHIDLVDEPRRLGTLRFDLFGSNKSNIQNERDPAKRGLGYRLLEHWGVLKHVGDFTRAHLAERLPALLALYDVTENHVTGALLDGMSIDPEEFGGAGYLTRRGWSSVILFDDEELGFVLQHVGRDGSRADAVLSLTEGGSGQQMPSDHAAEFYLRFDYLRDTLLQTLKPLQITGRLRELDPHLHHVGTAVIGLACAPIFLARGLSDDKTLERADRLVRGEHGRSRGIVFVPGEVRFPYLGSHVVLSLKDHLEQETGAIDVAGVKVAYEASIDPASRAEAVHFRRQGDEAAQLTVPGQAPRIITGAKKVRLFERLFMAYRDREPGVKLAVLKHYAGFAQLPQMFKDEWFEIKDRYLYSPRHGYWALCAEPISV